MKRNTLLIGLINLLISLLFTCQYTEAQTRSIGFENEEWQLVNAEVVEHMGRQSLKGRAILSDIKFENGIIEVDVSVTGERSYPGVIFRIQGGNFEHFYIRPHRAGLYPDALQYAPTFNGIGSWQLYNGEGFTAGIVLPENEWIHVKMEISGSQARVFIGDADNPALVIPNLQHGSSIGSIGVDGPLDGTAFFSNFSYTLKNDLGFIPPPETEPLFGFLTDWEISNSFRMGRIDLDSYPSEEFMKTLKWVDVASDPTGLVNIGKIYGRTGREPDCVVARTIINSEKEGRRQFQFGYSDLIAVFLNRELQFVGNSATLY
jgi:hypothetical protein